MWRWVGAIGERPLLMDAGRNTTIRHAALHAGTVLFFILAALYMTYPLIIGMTNTVGHPCLGLEGAYWIGEGSKIWTHPHDLWAATFFFPHRDTLITNQWTLGIYLMAGPVYLFTRNAILASNFYLLLGYFLNGLCMFFLTRHLLKNTYGALVAGFVFAYCPFRFSAPMLTGIMSNYWICLSLLFLHRFMESRREGAGRPVRLSRDALFAAFFFGLQCITDPFTGIFYSLMLALYLVSHFAAGRLRRTPDMLLNIIAAVAIVACMISPLFYPYMEMIGVRGSEDMARGLEESQILSCDLISYLVTPPTNFVYGWIPHVYKVSRAQYLFPGFVAGFLFIVGLVRKKGSHLSGSGEKLFLIILGILGILISFGPYISCGGQRICPGPYLLLYRWCPLFRSLRAIGWAAQLWLIPFAIFCGGGAVALLGCISARRIRALTGVSIILFILIEYFNKNASGDYFTAQNYHVDLQVPQVYEWLKLQPGEFGVLELPMPDNDGEFEVSGNETYYMFWSLYHGKRIVNGDSSFRPPEYWPLIDIMAHFPSKESIAILRALGVKYVIIHPDRYDYDEFEHRKIGDGIGKTVVERTQQLPDALRFVGGFGHSVVFELLARGTPPPPRREGTWREIKPAGDWKLTSTINQDLLPLIFDRNMATAWTAFHGCNLYNNNNTVEVDMGKVLELSRMVLCYRGFREFPRGVWAQVSEDGKSWDTIDVLPSYRDLVVTLINDPHKRELDMVFAPRRVRYIRLIQTLPSLWWSISELRLYTKGDNARETIEEGDAKPAQVKAGVSRMD
ncbi:MAG: discoidin domain-containing protein [Candidatus Aureabacteria bacterium]|nr:discoidin domain-containing protein [Candidatus Auribacterota bacterium]